MDGIATGGATAAKSALGGLFGIVSKYIVPIGFALIGWKIGSTWGFGSYLDGVMPAEMATFWKPGFGDLIIGAVELVIGLGIVTRDGIVMRAAGGFFAGMGGATMLAGGTSVGVVKG